MNDRDAKLFNLGNEFQTFIERLQSAGSTYTPGSLIRDMFDLVNKLRIACYSQEHKKSARYFMAEMTQEEFDNFKPVMELYKLNTINMKEKND